MEGVNLFPEIDATTLKGRDEVEQGLEQFVRLMLGPDGTLWANNQNGASLYAFKPSNKEQLNLNQQDIKSKTCSKYLPCLRRI